MHPASLSSRKSPPTHADFALSPCNYVVYHNCRLFALLNILYLLPNLLDFGFEIEHESGNLPVVRLGTDRVRLAVHLLDEKVDLFPYRILLAPEEIPKLRDVTIEPHQLLRDIRLVCENRRLQCNSIHGYTANVAGSHKKLGAEQVVNSRLELCRIFSLEFGCSLLNLSPDPRDNISPHRDVLCELRTLCLTHRRY